MSAADLAKDYGRDMGLFLYYSKILLFTTKLATWLILCIKNLGHKKWQRLTMEYPCQNTLFSTHLVIIDGAITDCSP